MPAQAPLTYRAGPALAGIELLPDGGEEIVLSSPRAYLPLKE